MQTACAPDGMKSGKDLTRDSEKINEWSVVWRKSAEICKRDEVLALTIHFGRG
jgi:hypothetical protein